MKCGECVLGVRQGAVCTNCEGTGLVVDQQIPQKPEAKKKK